MNGRIVPLQIKRRIAQAIPTTRIDQATEAVRIAYREQCNEVAGRAGPARAVFYLLPFLVLQQHVYLDR
jgi:hypothetical protein